MADRGNEVLLLARQVDLPEAQAVKGDEAADENNGEYQSDPAQDAGAGRRRQTIDAENEFEAFQRRAQTTAIQQLAFEADAGVGIGVVIRAFERPYDIALVRDDQVGHRGQRGTRKW